MMNNLAPYPAMKDSGVEWLGEVPAHWETPRLGNLLRERGETNADDSIQEVLSVLKDRGVIPYAEKGNIGNKRSDDITRYKIVMPGDIVVNCMNVIIGSVGLSRYTGCLSPVYYVLTKRSENDDIKYLNAYFQTKPFQRSLVRIGNGILEHRMRIPMELLKCELFPRPPLPEQAAIVRYLGYVERRIQRYVRTKRKLLGLLAEQKQAIIHRAVTRGLDPDVPLKPSGVEWLGDVPTHWEIRKLKSLMSSVNEQTSQRQNGDLYVALEHIESWTGRIIKTDIDTPFESQVKRFRSGDILFGKLRPYLAKVIRTNSRGVCVSELLVLRPHEVQISVPYMEQLLRTKPIIDTINSSTFGAKMPRANWQFIGRMLVSFPPLPEQTAIAEYLDEITTKIEAVIARIHREIELISEYRTRLIADVVTGKVDVREAVAKLPDEADDVMPDSDTADVLDSDTTFDETVELDMVAELGHEN